MAIGTLALLAGASALSGLLGTGLNHIQRKTDREFNAAEAEKQRNFEAEQAEINRDFQEMQRTTQYQTAATDMKKAGLNPAMMFSGSGSAASPTSGAMAHGNSASSAAAGYSNIGSILNGAANMANAMNYDNNKKNNVNTRDMVNMVANIAGILRK